MKLRIIEFKNGKFWIQGFYKAVMSEWVFVDETLKQDELFRVNSKEEALNIVNNFVIKEAFEEIEVKNI